VVQSPDGSFCFPVPYRSPNFIVQARIMENSSTADSIEVELLAPYFFDQRIGLWTGEPDRAALARALGAAPPHPQVEYETTDSGVRLRGPAEAVYEVAAALRELGLT
jgi:hypothetical protein